MANVLKGFEPALLWKYFEMLSAIPRSSGNEKGAADFVLKVASDLGLEAKRDEFNNVIVRKPASKGRENDAAVVLQGHLDMVCEKNKDKVFDFSKDGIQLKVDGDWLKADGTTLGGDNGVAVAAALALMESKDISHPPLEALFTTDEEVGLVGAKKLSPDFVKGRILLNLDSEEEGVVFIGCAGGVDTTGRILVDFENVCDNYEPYLLFVSGLKGGHSGLEINQQRGNAIRITARALWNLNHKIGIRIEKITGGNKRNAIPRETEAVIYVPKGKLDEAKKIIANFHNEIMPELIPQDPGLKIEILKYDGKPTGKVFSWEFTHKIFETIYALPHGVLEMSIDIPELVQTSTNLAIIGMEDEKTLLIQTSQRSSIESAKVFAAAQTESVLRLSGFVVNHENSYPAWPPNIKSELLKLSKKVYKDLRGSELKEAAIHAGLECGIIGEKYAGMDMISFGPILQDVHSPNEKLNIPSVLRFWEFLLKLLENIK
jgi:dipeptidase D